MMSNAVSLEDMLSVSPAVSSGVLVALRRAGWPFLDSLIRSDIHDTLLIATTELEVEFERLATLLVDRMHGCVHGAKDAAQRRWLLAVKRSVFNRRPLPPQRANELDGLPADLNSQLLYYAGLLVRRDEAPESMQIAVLDELMSGLRRLIDADEFRVAVTASSPTLAAALTRSEQSASVLSLRDIRSLYAYVGRFATKANPLHVFSRFIPGAAMSGRRVQKYSSHPACEVVFDVEALLALEQQVLSGPLDRCRVRVQLRPLVRGENGWQVWLKRNEGWCIARLPDSPVLPHLHEVFEVNARSRTPCPTLAELEELLASRFDESERASVRKTIDALLACGVLDPFLIDNLARPVRALQGLSWNADAMLACIDRWHLARTEPAQLGRLTNELAAIGAAREELSAPFHVNCYADDDLTDADTAVREISGSLAELRNIVTMESNFAPVQRVVRGFIDSHVQRGEAKPYLELLSVFLRRRADILEQSGWGRESPEFEGLARRCLERHGTLDSRALQTLVAGQGPQPTSPVCFVGPFDFVQRRFFLTNIFAGDQRFVSRYLPGNPLRPEPVTNSDAHLDVELALPRAHALNFVVRRFDAGFSFDRRWAHAYRRWLGPEQIVVRNAGGRPEYIDRVSGQRLRFHHRGSLVSTWLPVEYQLLLDDHPDSYRNPFADVAARTSDADVEHRQGLSFGPICLRRESWWIRIASVPACPRSRNPVSDALALRRWLHERAAPVDLYFFHVPGSGRRGEKPRLLDLASPLSIMAFRHALAGAKNDVVLTCMEPGPGGLWNVRGKGHVAELMVEI